MEGGEGFGDVGHHRESKRKLNGNLGNMVAIWGSCGQSNANWGIAANLTQRKPDLFCVFGLRKGGGGPKNKTSGVGVGQGNAACSTSSTSYKHRDISDINNFCYSCHHFLLPVDLRCYKAKMIFWPVENTFLLPLYW